MKKQSNYVRNLINYFQHCVDSNKSNDKDRLAQAYNESFFMEPMDDITRQGMIKFVAESIVPKHGVDFRVDVDFNYDKNVPEISVVALNDYGKLFVSKMLDSVSKISKETE